MTSWLKWRLCALLGASLLVGGTTYLHAQSDYPAPAKTPEEAARDFMHLLDEAKKAKAHVPDTVVERLSSPFFTTDPKVFLGSVDRTQIEGMPTKDLGAKLYGLLLSLSEKQNELPIDVHVTDTNGTQSIVGVTPSPEAKYQDIVVLAEDDGYRVDLKATLARWNDLSGEELDEQWYRYTGIISPVLAQSGNFLRAQCQTQMKQQMLGIFQYAQDYDEKLPPARKWVEVLQPYVRSEQLFQCPSIAKGGYGYAYNQRLSQFLQSQIKMMASTVNIYETTNPSRNWFGLGTGRAYRHIGGWNLAFADGHIKWFKSSIPDRASAIKFVP